MKQVIQDLSTGKTKTQEIPKPELVDGTVLIETDTSLVSSGTERMLIEFGRANYLQKAYQQPERFVKLSIKSRPMDSFQPMKR